MTDFESKGSHEGGGFQALNAKSTWSSFDEIPWEDFGCEDHGVPTPTGEKSSPSLWLHDRKNMEMKEESSAMDADNWDPAELVTMPDNLIAETGRNGDSLKQDSPDALLAATRLCMDEQMYNEDDAGQFSFSDAPNEEEMRLFGSENDVDKGGTLLEYTWDGLEDMNNLFQNEESAFGEDAAEALLQWTSSSSTPDSAVVKTTELRAMKGKSDEEVKMEFIPCDSYEKSSEACDSGANKPSNDHQDVEPLKLQTEAGSQISEEANSKKKLLVEDTIQFPTTQNVKEQQKPLHCDVDKAHLMKRQTSRKDRSKRQLYPKKPGQNINFKPVTHFHSSQPLLLQTTLQVYPQVVGATVAPSLVSPTLQPRSQFRQSTAAIVRHSPYVVQPGQALQHPQPVMMCYEPSDQQQQYNQQGRQKLDILAPPPVSGSNMTPQEKIEKLRWKQKMHRLASEQQQQQQQQITEQCIAVDPYAVQKQGKLQLQGKHPAIDTGMSVHAATIKGEEGEGAVEDAVLNQLLSVMSKLDVGTRIHIRDAFYRLARNAMNRHAADGASSTTNPTCEKNNIRTFSFGSQGALETETNPIDRTIVNLLFHRGQESTDMSSGNLTESEGSSRKPKSSDIRRSEASASQ